MQDVLPALEGIKLELDLVERKNDQQKTTAIIKRAYEFQRSNF
jgi:hypothetical protein